MPMKDLEQMITIGSKYRIIHMSGNNGSMESIGEFRGYAAFSDENAICIKLDPSDKESPERIRFIPYHAILVIDVLEQAPAKEVKKNEESRAIYQ